MTTKNGKRAITTLALIASVLGSGLALAPTASASTDQAYRAYQHAKDKLGKPYIWGAIGWNSYDCSGLVWRVYNQSGKNWKRTTAQGIYENYPHVKYMRNLRKGDLVFFEKKGDGDSAQDHVGLYAGNGKMIDAQNQGVTYETVWSNYWKKRYVISYGRVTS
jgi:cell wall-associated NlpC family hydrolase